jgi:hypothetical protein
VLPLLSQVCEALAAELQQAVKQPPQQRQQQQPGKTQQQQQQAPKGMRSGFLGPSTSQQQATQASKQQQWCLSSSDERGFDFAMSLIQLWELTIRSPEDDNDVRVFSDAAALSSMLPAVKLLLVLLQAQEPQTPAAQLSKQQQQQQQQQQR